MTLMLSKTYDALRSADGVSDEQAREAAEEIAAYENRLMSIESRLTTIDHRLTNLEQRMTLLTWMVAINLALTIAILFRLLVN
jgi:phage shock protein A